MLSHKDVGLLTEATGACLLSLNGLSADSLHIDTLQGTVVFTGIFALRQTNRMGNAKEDST